MTTEEKLRALLAEARETLSLHDGVVECDHPECRLYRFFAKGIDAALAEPVVDWQPHEPVGRTEYVVRVERERDEARAEVARLRWGNEMACENTPTRGCECPGCGLARERAERGEVEP